jgi:hypothetical protein
MPSITYEFDCVDLEIAPGAWLEQVLSGRAEISCPGLSIEDWWLDQITIDICGTRPLTLDHNSGNRELFAKLERALRRHEENTGAISEELNEAYYGEREAAAEDAAEFRSEFA